MDGATTVTVKLYYRDSDSVRKKRLSPSGIYPNSLSLHAVYQAGTGPWRYKELDTFVRVGFVRVARVTPDGAVLELHSKAKISWQELRDGRTQLQRLLYKRVYVSQGEPAVE